MSIRISKTDLIGVWKNQEVAPFVKNDNVEITLYLGGNETNNITITQNEETISYFSNELEVSEIEDGKFQITLKKSQLNNGNDLILKCRMYLPNKPKSFIANINQLGDRYFEKK